jgi:transcriptional regulator with XRE-family HTH domain
MTDISYNNSVSLNDQVLTAKFGKFVLHHRIQQNKTQEEVAKAAGISRSTLSLIERDGQTTLSTFIQVLRVLNLLYVMDTFEVSDEISPLAYAKMKKKAKKRASKTNNIVNDSGDLGW